MLRADSWSPEFWLQGAVWQGCNVNSCSGTDGERRKGSGRESGRSLFSLTLLRQTMEEGEEDQRHTQDGGRLMQSDRNGRRIKGWNQKREKDERVQTRVLRTIERGTEMPKERNRYSDTQVQGCTCFCRPPLLLLSIFPSIRVFANESVLRIRWPKCCFQ